jgi:hypothetical protein
VSWKKLGELGKSRPWMLLLAEVPFADRPGSYRGKSLASFFELSTPPIFPYDALGVNEQYRVGHVILYIGTAKVTLASGPLRW